MKSDLYNTIIKTSIPVFNKLGKIISYAFIIEFLIPNESDKVIPFLVMNYLDLKDLDYAILGFNATHNGLKEKYNVSFDRKFIDDSHIDDFLIHPIAGLLNDASSKNIKIEYFGLREDFILDLDKPKTRSIEDLSYFIYMNFNGLDAFPIVKKTHNITPFYSDNRDYFLIEDDKYQGCGFPVLIANEGSFNNEDGLCLGNRVLLAGVSIKKENGVYVVKYPKFIIDSIKNKFANLLPKPLEQ